MKKPQITSYIIYIDGKEFNEITVDPEKSTTTGIYVLACASGIAVRNPGSHVSVELVTK